MKKGKTTMNAAYLAPAITLFNEDGTLDLVSQEKLYNNLIENGVDGILVEGSSSEFFAMPMDQRREMAKFAIEAVDHRVKLIIGTSHMVADEIVSFSNFCLDAGADAVMILPPYYFHFGAEALLQYYDRLASQIHGNIYIYNFPTKPLAAYMMEGQQELKDSLEKQKDVTLTLYTRYYHLSPVYFQADPYNLSYNVTFGGKSHKVEVAFYSGMPSYLYGVYNSSATNKLQILLCEAAIWVDRDLSNANPTNYLSSTHTFYFLSK